MNLLGWLLIGNDKNKIKFVNMSKYRKKERKKERKKAHHESYYMVSEPMNGLLVNI